jgi:predicted nucleic acid-binding protein
MAHAWDTTTAARLRPEGSLYDYAERLAQGGDPIAFTATTLTEISYGLRKAAASGTTVAQIQLLWLRDQINRGLIDILPFDNRAADVAGALRAKLPIPPATHKRKTSRSKAENRVAWIMDLHTAATVFTYGYDLVTTDEHHTFIVDTLREIAPDGPPLVIQAPPVF